MLPCVEVEQREGARTARNNHRMELRGVLPPWVLDRLYHALQDSQEGQFRVGLSTVISLECLWTG